MKGTEPLECKNTILLDFGYEKNTKKIIICQIFFGARYCTSTIVPVQTILVIESRKNGSSIQYDITYGPTYVCHP